jgi:hypothetical protein
MIFVLTLVYISYLAAVLIIFIQEIVDDINVGREPEDRITYNILISSITVSLARIVTDDENVQ